MCIDSEQTWQLIRIIYGMIDAIIPNVCPSSVHIMVNGIFGFVFLNSD